MYRLYRPVAFSYSFFAISTSNSLLLSLGSSITLFNKSKKIEVEEDASDFMLQELEDSSYEVRDDFGATISLSRKRRAKNRKYDKIRKGEIKKRTENI